MLASGKWVAESPGDGETWSYQLSALYAPLGWISWRQLATERLNAEIAAQRNDFEPTQVLHNTRWAIPYDPGTAMTTAEAMFRRASDAPLREVTGGCILTCAVDVQGDYLDSAVQSWGRGLEAWVVDRQIIHGSPSSQDTWNRLDEYLQKSFYTKKGLELKIRATAIDTGYSSHDVYNFIRSRPGRHIIGTKGATRPNKPILSSKPTKVDVRWNGTVEKDGCELWMVGTDTCKQYYFDRWALTDGPGAVHFTKALGMPYFEGLMAEKRMVRQKKGRRVIEWVKPNGARNEPLDQVNYNLACVYYLGLHKFQDAEWDILEKRMAAPVAASAPAPKPVKIERPEAPGARRSTADWLKPRR
jgi:phage terminase large subunit GpA-like protein